MLFRSSREMTPRRGAPSTKTTPIDGIRASVVPDKSNGALCVLDWSRVSEPRSSSVVDNEGAVSSFCEATAVSDGKLIILQCWSVVALWHVPATALNDDHPQAVRLDGMINVHQERRPRVHPKDDILLDARLCKSC